MRLIDADAFKQQLQIVEGFEINKYGNIHTNVNALNIALERSTIDAEPVRHGKWKWLSCTYDRVPKEKEYECSECHHKTIVHGDDMPWERYCPNCGTRMDKE